MENTTEFQWTDELVMQCFSEIASVPFKEITLSTPKKIMEKFKQSKVKKEEPKQDWEILSFRYYGDIHTKDKDGFYKCPFRYLTYDFALKSIGDGNEIHSVKRLSDGEVFSIGDKVKYLDRIAPIQKFCLMDNNLMRVNCWNHGADFDNGISQIISNISHAPKESPLPMPIKEVIDEDGMSYRIISENEFVLRESESKELNFDGCYGYVKDGKFFQSKHKKNKHPEIKYAAQSPSQSPLPIKVEVTHLLYREKHTDGEVYEIKFNKLLGKGDGQRIQRAIERELNPINGQWDSIDEIVKNLPKLYTSDELLEAQQKAFWAGRNFKHINPQDYIYPTFNDYIQSLNK